MEGGAEPVEGLAFGRFRLDATSASLWRGTERVLLRARSLDILRTLAAANGKLVTKDELIARVWRGTIIEENVLQVHVSVLRKALGESVGTQRIL
jgi:DNA-binding winged helix-turn-helix (wHTH) protein